MPQEYDFANAANWVQASYTSRNAEQPTANTFIPIPELDVSGPFPLNAPIIATYATCSTARPTWNTAGWLYQHIRAGIADGGNYGASVYGSRRVPLSRIQIHFWEREIKDYQLRFKCPKWIYQISLTIWQYTGPIIEPTQETIDLARIDILRTEAKVDALFKDWEQ